MLLQFICDDVHAVADQYVLTDNRLDTIAAQLHQIRAFGIGYCDAVTHIAIPLIIALFAFAFAYLFTVITRINEKYDSESISKMIKTSGSFRCYLWGSGFSVGYIILFGLLSLLFSGSYHPVLMVVLSWGCLIVAGVYAGIILRFVRTCLEYDDHSSLLSVIGTRYERNKKKQRSLNNYNNRLIELCKYAIRIKHSSLFGSILTRVNEYDKAEKEKRGGSLVLFTVSFYDSIVKDFIQAPHGGGMERNLFEYWQQTLRHDELPDPTVFSNMLGSIVEVVKQGQYPVFEAYAEMCRSTYGFINRVADVKYIVGKDAAEQKRIDDGRLTIWRELREVHFLAASYLFSLGHYEVATVFKKKAGYYRDSFFPLTIPEVLKMYVDCKEKQDLKSGLYAFEHGPYNDLSGDKYDREILERFTALLLLVMGPLENDGKEIVVGEKKMHLLSDCKDEIIKYGRIWRNHEDVNSRFPQIQGVTIEDQMTAGLSRLTTGRDRNTPGQTVFDLPLTSSEQDTIRGLFSSFFSKDNSVITDSLVGDFDDSKKESIALGPYTFLVDKSVSVPNFWEDQRVRDNLTKVFGQRYLYAVFDALSQMKVTETVTSWDHFEKLFLKYVGNKGEHYAVLDTNCSLKGQLELDKPVEGQNMTYPLYYKGAYYFETGSHFPSDLLRDVALFKSYHGTLTVIRLADLPALQVTSDDNAQKVVFSNESNGDNGWAAARVKVDPCLSIRFRKEAEVLRIRIKE